MGSQIDTIKDIQGNNHFIFDESSLYDDSQMGEKVTDFEILQFLSEDEANQGNDSSTSFVAKVRSLNNNKIYAMKKIELNIKNPQFIQDSYNAINKLITLNNPHIIKYYKVFMDEKYNFFLIMEFMNNADINGFIKAHQVLNKIIKEEEMWNILLQCLSAIDYLHKQNLGNLGIQFYNIFMNNEQNAKISVFNKPNFIQNYDLKNDIYLLGKYFYIMSFSHEPYIQQTRFSQVVINEINNPYYSKELMNIIYWMVKQNPNERPYTNQLYNVVKKAYVNKYARNTSINAILRCLYSYPKIHKIINQNGSQYSNNIDKYYISYWNFLAIRALCGNNETNLKECVEEFRRAIALENSKLDGNKEIDPLHFIAFLLLKMHKETNKKYGNNGLGQNQNGNNANISIFNREEEDKTNREQMLFKFIEYFNLNVHSPISDLFFGFVKTKRICQTCRNGYYSFSNFCFVVFDISQNNNNIEFNLIKDGFYYQHNTEKVLEPNQPGHVYCERCLSYQKHFEFNRYYMMNHQLIISFIRGSNYQNYSNIIFDEFLNLKDFVDEKDASPTNYYLVGCINRVFKNGNEEFIYFARDPFNMNVWYVDGGKYNFNNAPINEMKSSGLIIMLFYNNNKDINLGNQS